MNKKLSELLKDYPDVINVLERKQDSNLEEYLEYALEHGCFIRTDKNVSKNCVTQRYTLASKIVDPDSGFEVIFETTFDRPNGFDGSSFLFFFCEDAEPPHSGQTEVLHLHQDLCSPFFPPHALQNLSSKCLRLQESE